MNPTDITPRQANGRFPPGKSGNPKGRPKSETAALRKTLSEASPDVVKAVLDAAISGDMTAAKIVLDRICPPLKPIAVPVTIEMPPNPTPIMQAEAILDAASSGQISSDIASQLIQGVSNITRIIEAEDLKDRLEALERITRK